MRLCIVYYPWHWCFISTKFCDKDNKSLRHPWGVLCHLLIPPVIHQCLLSNDSTDQCWVIFIFANQNLHLNVCIRCTCIAYKQNISVPWSKWCSHPLHTDYMKSCCYCFRKSRFTLSAYSIYSNRFVFISICCLDVINDMFIWIEVQIKSADLYRIWSDMYLFSNLEMFFHSLSCFLSL